MKFLRGLFLLLIVLTSTTQTAARPVTTTSSKATTVVRRPFTNKKATKQPIATVKKTAVATPAAAMPAWKADLLHRAKVGFYFGLWYALNIVYNSK